jgi:hypothetical protein
LPGLKALVGRQSVRDFLRAVALRIRIIPIRIVVVRGAGIHSIQNDTQETALHTQEQIPSAREGFLGSFTAAYYEENAIRFDGQDNGIGSGHDGR